MKASELIIILSDKEFLSSIHWIGQETINLITSWVSSNSEDILKLESYWVVFNNYWNTSLELEHIRFAITWTFPIERKDMISSLIKRWATYSPNVTKSTNLLIVWDNPSSKLAKAQCTKINYEQFTLL